MKKMLLVLFTFVLVSAAVEPDAIQLPKPVMEGGKPLMQALRERATIREISGRELPLEVLSNLLWAAWGVNRQDSGKRTAPSASNRQEIDVYVTTAKGVFLYDAKAHRLVAVSSEDVRVTTGKQDFVKNAPVNLLFVADFARMGGASEENKVFYSAVDTGYISQNVYLFCASEGLATVARGGLDRPVLVTALKLRPEQRVILAQTVGYPAAK
jgi:SagB-type dehydrogenase family enzyme